MMGPARKRAAGILSGNIEMFRRAGYQEVDRPDLLVARLESATGEQPLVLRMAREGRVFGGTYAFEIVTADPVLPPSRGISARGRGVVRLSGFTFRARRGDPEGNRLALRLTGDRELTDALKEVHFERIRVDSEGHAVIRHMGGSLVWILFPPLVRPIPLIEAQARATLRALEAFARAGRD